ncbi:hypothetical protein MML48_3g00003727 [Holotrichia oblita]|uniref:Uncharacterized protein n=1 Tax=Holotrichia oblita TaxID=644536 RepID=A0ACB9THD6_HOLOL|nr:hypothetical protein MML48_3g00003727 [Holotrichia oblita]
MNFTKEEMVNMIYALSESERNCLVTSRIYYQCYPNARPPRIEAFQKLKERFEASGNIGYSKKKIKNRRVTSEENELNILLWLEENPQDGEREGMILRNLEWGSILFT